MEWFEFRPAGQRTGNGSLPSPQTTRKLLVAVLNNPDWLFTDHGSPPSPLTQGNYCMLF